MQESHKARSCWTQPPNKLDIRNAPSLPCPPEDLTDEQYLTDEDPAGYKKETVKTTAAEKVPQISIGKEDPHSFNTTLLKEKHINHTMCLATALGKSTKAWGKLFNGRK